MEDFDVLGDFFKSAEGESFKELVEDSQPVKRVNEDGLKEVDLSEVEEVGLSTAVTKVFDAYSVAVGGLPMSAKQEQFLRAYVKCRNLTKALTVAGVHKADYNRWMKSDTKFSEVVGNVTDFVADLLEDVALEMALSGNEKMLTKMLEAYRPEKFSPKRAIDINSQHNVNINDWASLAKKAMEEEKKARLTASKVVEADIIEEGEENEETVLRVPKGAEI